MTGKTTMKDIVKPARKHLLTCDSVGHISSSMTVEQFQDLLFSFSGRVFQRRCIQNQ